MSSLSAHKIKLCFLAALDLAERLIAVRAACQKYKQQIWEIKTPKHFAKGTEPSGPTDEV